MNLTQEQTIRPETVSSDRNYVAPEVNIFENAETYILEADMPGVGKEGLEVLLEGNSLTIVGRRSGKPEAQGDWIHRESLEADFRRVFELDPAIDTKNIIARMDQGVLIVKLPKAEKVKPRKIEVTE
jgi:HSP20 family protein